MNDRIFYSNRYNRKRSSFDYTTKQDTGNKSKPTRKDIAELSIDLNPKKNVNMLSLHGKNHTHRIQNNDMCQLREEVEQLRMENQSLKEQLSQMRKNEEQLKYEIMRAKEEVYGSKLKYDRIEYECTKMGEKIDKYSRKIRDLYEQLIEEKKKHAGAAVHDTAMSRIKSTVSPSARSTKSTSLYYKQLEKEGERDYYSSLAQLQRHQHLDRNQLAWSVEHSPGHASRIPNSRDTFGTIF